MTDRERWQRDLEEMEIVVLVLFCAAWVAFWYVVTHS